MSTAAPSLRLGFAHSFAGNAVFAASLWGILIFLTRLGSPADVGRYALASAVATPLLVFANLQLRPVLIADTAGDHPFAEYLGVRLLMLPAALAALAVIAGLGYGGAQAAAILVFGLARLVEGISDLFHGLAQKNERLDLVAVSLAIKGAAGLALFAVLFLATGDLTWALLGLPLGWAVPLLFFDIPRCGRLLPPGQRLRPRWRPAACRRIVWTALPLGLVMLLIQLRHTVPRTLLEQARGEADLGVFAAVAYLVLVGNTVVLALSQAGIARLARARAAGQADLFRTTVLKLVAVGAGLGAAGVLAALAFGEPLLTLLYGAEYARHQDLFVLVMAAGGVMYVGSLLGAPATALRAFRIQLGIHAVNAALLLAVGALLIPRHGMMGAGWTTLAGAVWVAAAYAAVVGRGVVRLGTAERSPGGRS